MSKANEHDEPQTPRAPPSPPQSPRVAIEQEPQTPRAPPSLPQSPRVAIGQEPQTPKAPPSPPRSPRVATGQEPQTPRAPPSPPQSPKAQEQREPRAPKAPKKQKAMVPKEQHATVPKVPFVMFLGVAIDAHALHSITSLCIVDDFIAKYSELIYQDAFHITLLFFQKKCANKGEIVGEFKQLIAEHGAEVAVTVTGIGYHEGTCALQVSSSILTNDGSNTPVPWTHEKQNHITIALEEGKSAKNSVIAVMKQEESGDYPGEFISFELPFVITGNLRAF